MTDREPSARQTPSLEDVAARLAAVQEREAKGEQARERRRGNSQGADIAMRIGIELVVAVMVGLGIGWFIDDQLGTSPIFLLAFVALGFTTGVLNVVRLSRGLDQREGIGWGKNRKGNAGPPLSKNDDDDE